MRRRTASSSTGVVLRLAGVEAADAEQPPWNELAPQDGEWRVEFLGRLVADRLSRGAIAEARGAWYEEALSAQRVASSSHCFAAYAAAAARISDKSAWRLVLNAATTQDPWRRGDLAQSAAEACNDRGRLAELEKLVTSIGAKREATDAYLRMHVALGRAWIRLGDPLRGILTTASGLAVRQREGGALTDSECESVRELVDLCPDTTAVQLVLWLLVMQFSTFGFHPTHSFVRIIATCARSTERRWARNVLTALYRRLVDYEDLVITSVWDRTAARVAFALGLEEGRQTAAAALVATEWDVARYRAEDQWMTNIGGWHNVYAVTALCVLALLEAKWSRIATVGSRHRLLNRLRKSIGAVMEAVQKEFDVSLTPAAGDDTGSANAAWSLAEVLAQTSMARSTLGMGASNTWNALEALAKGRAESGHPEIALDVVRNVLSTKHRDQMMYELARLTAARTPLVTLQILSACSEAETRRRVGIVAAASATLHAMDPPRDPREQHRDRDLAPWQVPKLGVSARAAVLGLAVAALCDGVIYFQLIPWIRMALSRAQQVGVALPVILVGAIIGWKALGGVVRDRKWRLIGSVLLLPFVPFFIGFSIASDKHWLKALITVRTWCLRIRTRATRSKGSTHSELSVNRDVLAKFLRVAVTEASSLDVALAAAIARTAQAQNLPHVLDALPALSIPHSEPDTIRRGQEWRARHSRFARFRRRVLPVPSVLQLRIALGREVANRIWQRFWS